MLFYRPIPVLAVMWQLIKTNMLSDIVLNYNTELIALFREKNYTFSEDSDPPPEQLLLRWMNCHLRPDPANGFSLNNFHGSKKACSSSFDAHELVILLIIAHLYSASRGLLCAVSPS
jgi:hypothetical protein